MKIFKAKSMLRIISVIFLFMILSRLTWLQLRHYPIESLGFLGPEILDLWALQITEVRTWNVNTIIALFFLSALIIRIITHSWVIGLFSVTVLMSRGVVLSRVGWMSLDLTLSLMAAAYFTCLAHHLRTGSLLSRLGSYLCVLAGTLLEVSFFGLAFNLPLYQIFLKIRTSAPIQSPASKEGLLKALPYSFQDWVLRVPHAKRKILLELFLNLGVIAFLFLLRWKTPNFLAFQVQILSFLDLHYFGSLLLIAICALYGWKKQNRNFLIFQNLFLNAMLLWFLSSSLLSFLKFRAFIPQSVLLWLEPIVLCLGCASGVFILEELRNFFQSKRWFLNSKISTKVF